MNKVRTTQVSAYGFLFLPLAFGSLPIYLHAPDLYATHYGLSLHNLGIALLALRLIDAFQDPIIGRLSDLYHHKRLQILSCGSILFALGFWLCFHPIHNAKIYWFAASIFLCTTGFSIIAINAQTLGGLWPANEHERTKITAYREAFGMIGLLLASIIPSLFFIKYKPDQVFHLFSLLFLGILISALIMFRKFFSTVKWPKIRKEKIASSKRRWSLWQVKFYTVYFISNLASSIPAVLVIFFVRDHLNAEHFIGAFLLIYFLSGAIGMSFWQRLSKRKGKFEAWGIGMLCAATAFVWCFTLSSGDLIQYGLICFFSGLALGSDLCLPPSILADYIAHQKTQSKAGSYFSTLTFLTKSSLAIATGAIFFALGAAGYQPGQTYTGAFSLPLAYAMIPSIIKVLAIILLYSFLKHLNTGVNHENRSHSHGITART